ncbi:MAG: ABC transporter substrate-binding protein [Pseudomonadota bacterium]
MSEVRRRRFLAAAGWLLIAPLVHAQQPGRKFRLGFLLPVASPIFFDPFTAAMRQHGWTEGRDFVLETRVTPGYERSAELARELVALKVDLIVSLGTVNAMAARDATRTIPIVMFASGYPVEVGLVESYRRPGTNVTGLSSYAGGEVWGKYLELLGEVRPRLRELAVFWDYAPPVWSAKEIDHLVVELRKAARHMGINLHLSMVRSEKELVDAIAAATRASVEALLVTSGGGVHNQPAPGARIANFILERRLPAVTDFAGTAFAAMRCVLAYAVPIPELAQRAASFVNRILRGARPGELPIEFPTRFELVVNIKVARQIDLKIPQSIMLRADRVIE